RLIGARRLRPWLSRDDRNRCLRDAQPRAPRLVVAQQPRLCPPAHDIRARRRDRTPDGRLGRMHSEEERARLSAAYRRFAEDEARGKSPLYEILARGVADDNEILDFLLILPQPKRQPNLLLAATRSLLGTPADWAGFRRSVTQRKDALHT